LLIYPNPVQEKICFRYSAVQTNDATVIILNPEGKVVLQSAIQIVKGANNYCYSIADFKSGGCYFLKVSLNNRSVTAKFIK